MFQLDDGEYRYWWPVTVYRPSPEKPGSFEKFRFEAQFVVRGEAGLDDVPALVERYSSHKTLLEVVVGWKDVTGPDGQPVEFSEQALRGALSRAYVRQALTRAYINSLSGIEEKN